MNLINKLRIKPVIIALLIHAASASDLLALRKNRYDVNLIVVNKLFKIVNVNNNCNKLFANKLLIIVNKLLTIVIALVNSRRECGLARARSWKMDRRFRSIRCSMSSRRSSVDRFDDLERACPALTDFERRAAFERTRANSNETRCLAAARRGRPPAQRLPPTSTPASNRRPP